MPEQKLWMGLGEKRHSTGSSLKRLLIQQKLTKKMKMSPIDICITSYNLLPYSSCRNSWQNYPLIFTDIQVCRLRRTAPLESGVVSMGFPKWLWWLHKHQNLHIFGRMIWFVVWCVCLLHRSLWHLLALNLGRKGVWKGDEPGTAHIGIYAIFVDD